MFTVPELMRTIHVSCICDAACDVVDHALHLQAEEGNTCSAV